MMNLEGVSRELFRVGDFTSDTLEFHLTSASTIKNKMSLISPDIVNISMMVVLLVLFYNTIIYN